MQDGDRKRLVAEAAEAFAARRIGKRAFLRRLGLAGIGLSGFAATMLGGNRPFSTRPSMQALAQGGPPTELTRWLRDVGSRHKGTTIRYVSEATPPTLVAKALAREEFTAHTGIEVDIEIVPLEQVLQKVTADTQARSGAYDLYYIDQSWTCLLYTSDAADD